MSNRYMVDVAEIVHYTVTVTAETPEAAKAAALRVEPSNGQTPDDVTLQRVAGDTRELPRVGRPLGSVKPKKTTAQDKKTAPKDKKPLSAAQQAALEKAWAARRNPKKTVKKS